MSWICLKNINSELFGDDPLTVAFDCFSVFAESKGILLVVSRRGIKSIKLTVTENSNEPLKVNDVARIKGINGSTVVKDELNSFLVADGRIYAFKSFKKIYELKNHSNVKLLQFFADSCFVLVQQIDSEVKVLLYHSFGEPDDVPAIEFDISLPLNPAGNSRDSETMCVEFIAGPLSKTDSRFFTELLACDLKKESIVDVLLICTDDKLLWIKYSGGFRDGSRDSYTIETITTGKGNIRALKYVEGSLLMLDGASTLSVFYLCPATGIVRKREVFLEGAVKCYRFYQQKFIYSDMKKVYFVDISSPLLPAVTSVNLKGIVCFTIVENLDFIIAICCNQLFYYLPMKPSITGDQETCRTDFQVLRSADIELIPSVAKFINREETKLLSIEKTAKELQNLKIVLLCITKNKNFVAGEASITFHQLLPQSTDSTIVCRITDQKIGSEFIELRIQLAKILEGHSITILFHRQAANGSISRLVNIADAKEVVQIVLPAEEIDHVKNEMSLDLHFTYKINGETKLIVLPITITKVIPSSGRHIKLKSSLDECIDAVDKMKTLYAIRQ